MSNDVVIVPPDSTGKALDVENVANGGSGGTTTVYRQRFELSGAALAAISSVLNAAPAGTEYGLVTRPIPMGVNGTNLATGETMVAGNFPCKIDFDYVRIYG